MPLAKQKIVPCLWYDGAAEPAARHYVSIFPNSSIGTISRYGKAGHEQHQRQEGSVMTVEFSLDGQGFLGLNGGPQFKFTEAVSFQIHCADQAEVDHYWSRLSEGGEEGPCGWLKDRFGLSWQVVPRVLIEMLLDQDKAKVERVTKAFMQMRKFDLAALRRAYHG